MATRMGTQLVKPNPDCPYCTPGELSLFRQMRERGTISVFREGICAGTKEGGEPCDVYIPKTKQFCSAACAGVVLDEPVDDDGDDYDEED